MELSKHRSKSGSAAGDIEESGDPRRALSMSSPNVTAGGIVISSTRTEVDESQIYQEHACSLFQLQARLDIILDDKNVEKSPGLTTQEATMRLDMYGRNALTPPPSKSDMRRLLEKFIDPFMILLELAAVLSYVLYAVPPHGISNLYVAVVLTVIILLTCVLSYYQEGQSVKLMSSFASLMSPTAQVIRDGCTRQHVPSAELTVGDLVVLESGERVPADVRVIYSDGLRVDNASFTGESHPIEIRADNNPDEKQREEDALHARNMAFNSALVVEGRGVGIVVRVGDKTMIGKIAHLVTAQNGTPQKSTLEVEVLHFVHFISCLAIATGIAFYVAAVARGGDPVQMFIQCFVVIVIANVPEGLPATVTSCLTISARRLAQRQVFVKRLDVIETLGSTSVVASDKTGTLTQNKMTVSHLMIDGRLRSVDHYRHDVNWRNDAAFLELLTAGTLCNMARFEDAADNVLVPISAAALASTLEQSQYSRARRGLSNSHHSGTHVHARSRDASLPGILQREFFEPPTNLLTGVLVGGEAETMEAGARMQEEGDEDEDRPIPVRKLTAIFGQASFGGLLDRLPTTQQVQHNRSNTHGSITKGHRSMLSGADVSSLTSYSTWGAHTRMALHALELPARKVVGNPSDAAILSFCHAFVNVDDLKELKEQVFQIPFNSRNKWMMSVNLSPANREYVAYLKGAPEIIVGRCTTYLGKDGSVLPIDEAFRGRFQDMYQEVARKGERVLALSMRRLDAGEWPVGISARTMFKDREEQLPRDGLTFVGMMSLVDPPKQGVAEAVLKCKAAGIRVMMITGDHPLTAEAIARQVNIINEFNTREEVAKEEGKSIADVPDSRVGAAVIFCKDLEDYDDVAWASLLAKPELVFARASPQDKLTIVNKLKDCGEIVAVTGDGVNDSPALKSAHVGIAMGIMGSEVAKNAANVILMDDDFSTIVNGIEEGRVLFDNLTKTIAYTLAHTLPELLSVVISILFSMPVGLTSLMILSVDLLTEICPSISFAWEPPESSVMRRPPRQVKTDRLVRPSLLFYSYLQAGLIEAVACIAAYLAVFWCNGVPVTSLPNFAASDPPSTTVTIASTGRTFTHDEQVNLASMAATAFYATLVLSQAVHIFSVKTRLISLGEHGLFCNVSMNFGVLAALGIMCFICFVPGINDVFGAYPRLAAPFFLLPALAAGALLLVWSELRKATLRNLIDRPTATFARIFGW